MLLVAKTLSSTYSVLWYSYWMTKLVDESLLETVFYIYISPLILFYLHLALIL